SGGAGCARDFLTLFRCVPGVDAGLAASVFHFRQVEIEKLKRYLAENGIPVRI
ncbi:MAG TPA: imidazole glycerol phosphate synthase subunit HisF, partial [Clostridiales bacterium]|nr:imidazole glycerol phosphate synthase subunit HisF [Clostridiales bacterium]